MQNASNKKAKCYGRTDGRKNGWTDGPTEIAAIETRASDKKKKERKTKTKNAVK